MSPRDSTPLMLRCLIAATGLAACMPALANDDCDVYRLGLPDFDQRREADPPFISGLPGNGSTHCAPTAVMNLLAYACNNGYPNLIPAGPRNWENPDAYGAVTMLINWLGQMMQTDGGTTYTNGFAGLNEWMDTYSNPDEFVVSVPAASGVYAPSPKQIHDLKAAGALVVLCTSGWTVHPPIVVPQAGGGLIQLPERFVRTGGGHCVTVSRVTNACSSGSTIWFRDPAGFGGDLTSQAPFVTQSLQTESRPAWYAGTATSTPIFRTMHRFIFPDRPDKNSMINGLYVIVPLMGLDADAQTGEIVVSGMHQSDDLLILPDATHSTPGNAPILGLRFLPDLGAAIVLTRAPDGRSDVQRFSLGTGEFETVATIDAPTGPGAVAIGRAGEVYTGSTMQMGGVNVCMADGSVRFVRVGIDPVALAFDDQADRLLGIFTSANGTHALGTFVDLAGSGAAPGEVPNPVAFMSLPGGIELGGPVSMAISPLDGTIFLTSQQSPGVYALVRTGPGTIALDASRFSPASAADNLSVDRAGRVTFTSGGVVRRFGPRVIVFPGTPEPIEVWSELADAKYAGRQTGGIFQLAVGRGGNDDLLPRHLDGIDDPSEFPSAPIVCIADFNRDDGVDDLDIAAFFLAFESGEQNADVNNDSGIDDLDISAFFAAFESGC